jgi:hypothetical protein
LLLRLTDDFLYMSTDKARAVQFGTILHQGVPEFQCFVNARKSLCNFSLEVPPPVPGVPSVAVPQMDAGGAVPWCGLLFRPCTGEVLPNFSRQVFSTLRLRPYS